MLSKTRVKKTFEFELPDRIPINYMCNPGIDLKLKRHFGLDATDDEGLRRALNVDFRKIDAGYIGPPIHKEIPGRKVDPIYGFVTRYVEHETGGYWEYCDFPLLDAALEQVEAFPFPDPDDFNYENLADQCREYKDYGIVAGNNGTGLVMCRAGFYRGMEQALMDLVLEEPAGLRLIERFIDFQLAHIERVLDKVGKQVDVLWMGEDLGTQIGPLISMDTFQKRILPYHKKFFDLAGSYGIPVMLHTCGSSSWAYEEYIKVGLRAVDTLQPEAKDMSPEYLKKAFGGRLVFHGCISTAGALTYGTVQEAKDDFKNILDIMMPGGGYCMAPTHRLQDNTPLDNAIAVYSEAMKYGKYE